MKTNGEPTVKIAAFKARLSHYLRMVRRGETVILLDRETPIAKVEPVRREWLPSRQPTLAARDVKLPPPLRARVDSLRILQELRRDRT